MRELTEKEIMQVSGGFGPVGAVLGGAIGGGAAIASGESAGVVVSSTILGATSGFFGGIAAATSGLARYMFGAYAVEIGIIGSVRES